MGWQVDGRRAPVVIGGLTRVMVMTLLVGRIIYLLFDSLADRLVWVCTRVFHVNKDQLAWLVGEYREEKVAGMGQGNGTAGISADIPKEA